MSSSMDSLNSNKNVANRDEITNSKTGGKKSQLRLASSASFSSKRSSKINFSTLKTSSKHNGFFHNQKLINALNESNYRLRNKIAKPRFSVYLNRSKNGAVQDEHIDLDLGLAMKEV
jgi:hypothetical protein